MKNGKAVGPDNIPVEVFGKNWSAISDTCIGQELNKKPYTCD
jgi:hypothetical protein